MKKLSKVLEEIAKRYDLTKDLLEVRHEYKGRNKLEWYAIIAIHMESDTCYLAQWNENITNNKTIDIRQYKGTDNTKALKDFYEFIIA